MPAPTIAIFKGLAIVSASRFFSLFSVIILGPAAATLAKLEFAAKCVGRMGIIGGRRSEGVLTPQAK
ncbi:MAG: hypothetical protein JOZ58_05075 [Acetobacteraceae bacterium]|nr:hypothetical protein [Acetobacteraceae bacterium]